MGPNWCHIKGYKSMKILTKSLLQVMSAANVLSRLNEFLNHFFQIEISSQLLWLLVLFGSAFRTHPRSFRHPHQTLLTKIVSTVCHADRPSKKIQAQCAVMILLFHFELFSLVCHSDNLSRVASKKVNMTFGSCK